MITKKKKADKKILQRMKLETSRALARVKALEILHDKLEKVRK